MAYSPNPYYSPSALPGQSLGKRSSSESSTTSSSPSCSAPYGSVSMRHADTPRTLSPLGSGVPSSAAGTAVMYSRTPYHSFAHDQLHPAHTQPTSFSPQYLEVQVVHSLPVYQAEPAPRQLLRPAPFNGYALEPLAHHQHHPPQHHPQHHHHQQHHQHHAQHHHHHLLQQQPSPPMSYYEYAPVYSSYTSAHYHPALPPPPPPGPPSHPTPPMDDPVQAREQEEEEEEEESWLIVQMKRLPDEVVREIQKHIGWYDGWNASQISSWFLRNMHPDKLPREVQLAGLLHAEQNYGRYGSHDSGTSVSKRSANKGPTWLGCYHCFRCKGFEHFELFRWGNTSGREDDGAGEGGDSASYMAPAPRADDYPSSRSPTPGRTSPANSNPHYDPTLTRSSLMASVAAARNARGGSVEAGDAASYTSPRIKQTWGIRRFCVDCGLNQGYYRPGDVIDLQQPLKPRDAIWVCRCRKLRHRHAQFECQDCKMHCPLSNPSRGSR
ncbi:hypothetical protein C8A05DRAFT_37150 [Staphylotrichum tortipilum]|uniref:Uncharacterized protein n=1 Tax=Staphylotrichum tortipilum TaxID=2831512 RepID=A0AAN6MFN8_9PEZI|nr:hypothetical protein C8A05DRAFT_37150 [Staphylotrichum longicolle]